MKQQNAAAQRGTARAGRWLARALLVVGGAVAGTAAAWAITTASASAETAPPALPQDGITVQQDEQATPVTDAVLGGSDDVLLGSAQFAGDAAGAAARYGTGAQSPDSIARGQQAADDVTGAVHEFGRTAVVHPAHRILGSAEQITREPQDAPRVIGQALTPPQDFLNFLHPSRSGLVKLPALTGSHSGAKGAPAAPPVELAPVAPAPAGPMGPIAAALPSGHAAAAHPDLRDDSGARRHGAQSDRFPFAPTRGPLVPSGVPFVPGGSVAGGHVDGPLLGVPANALTVVDAHGLRAVRFGIRHTPVQPGSQPGVTPD